MIIVLVDRGDVGNPGLLLVFIITFSIFSTYVMTIGDLNCLNFSKKHSIQYLPVILASNPLCNLPVILESNPLCNLSVILASNPLCNLPVLLASNPLCNLPVILASNPGINLPVILASNPGCGLPGGV